MNIDFQDFADRLASDDMSVCVSSDTGEYVYVCDNDISKYSLIGESSCQYVDRYSASLVQDVMDFCQTFSNILSSNYLYGENQGPVAKLDVVNFSHEPTFMHRASVEDIESRLLDGMDSIESPSNEFDYWM